MRLLGYIGALAVVLGVFVKVYLNHLCQIALDQKYVCDTYCGTAQLPRKVNLSLELNLQLFIYLYLNLSLTCHLCNLVQS